jgi:hypothetical protein
VAQDDLLTALVSDSVSDSVMQLPLGDRKAREETKFNIKLPTVWRPDLYRQRFELLRVPESHFIKETLIRIWQDAEQIISVQFPVRVQLLLDAH